MAGVEVSVLPTERLTNKVIELLKCIIPIPGIDITREMQSMKQKPLMSIATIATVLGGIALLVAMINPDVFDTSVPVVVLALAFVFMVAGLLRGENRQ